MLTILISWNVVGFFILILIGISSKTIGSCPNSDFFSPLWIYKNIKVNWFGAVVLALLLNILCPVWSISCWFYKLCTVGR